MIRKKRMGKGIAKILSGLLVFGMVAGLVPAVPGGTVHAKAEDVSEPGVTAYATKEQLMTAFTPDADGNAANVGKLLFGKNASGAAQDWYILGKDAGVNGDNTIIFAASPMQEKVLFNDINDIGYITYVESYGTYADGNPTAVNANHYGASNLRAVLQNMAGDTNYFSAAEQALMQATTVITKDVKIEKDYTTTDKLYAIAGDYGADILKAGSDNSVLLQRSAYWSSNKFWLRSPNYHDGWKTSNDAYYISLDKQNVQYISVNNPNCSVRPATNLDLSNVLFASAVTCNNGTANIGEAMTLRLDGKNKGIGTVTYNASTKKIKVDRGNTTDRVYLMVQCKLGGQESLKGCTIDDSQDVTLFSDDVDLSKCKIWLETTDADGMIYAVEATEENGGTPAEEHTGIHSIDLPSGETWQGVDSLDKISDAGYYYLTDNVSLTETWTPQNNVVLCLNGKTITMNADDKAVIEVGSNNSFTLCDCKDEGKVTHGTKPDGSDKYSGSGVNVNGTFTMYGGSISGNTADQGGGVYNSGTFNMNGGTISENTSNVTGSTLYGGGGVYNAYGTFNMNGGIISKNSVRDCGGGVANYQGTFHMSGGEIKGNVSGNSGGGVYQDGDLTLSGATVITGNEAQGENNNLYISVQRTVSASGLANGARIGVTTELNPDNDDSIIITSDSADKNYFVPDNSKYETAKKASGQVILKLKAETTTEAPIINTQPQSVSVKAGEAATFTVGAIGSDLNYQWQVNKNDNAGFVNIDGANSESYILNTTGVECNGYQYQCVVSNVGGSVTSDSVTLTVTEDTTPTSYNLWIGGTQVTSQNTSGTGWKYDAGTNTLTLTDYTYSGVVYEGNDGRDRAVIWCSDDLNINLAGNSKVDAKRGSDSHSGYDCAIYVKGNLTINGSGSLNAGCVDGFNEYGIYAGKKLAINGGTIVATATLDNCAFSSTGLYAGGELVIGSANVTAKAGELINSESEYNKSYGIESKGSITIAPDAVINAEGKTAAINKKPEGYTGTIGLVFQQNNPTPNPNPEPEPTPSGYEIINGANSSWTQNTDGSLAIRGNGEVAKFQSVKVDGAVVDPANYTVTEGSTIITLNAAYLQTLSAGSHTFEIVWTDGSASTSFTVAANTPGGNNNNNNGNNNGSSNTSNNQPTTVNTGNTDNSQPTTTDSNVADTANANQSAVSPKTGEDFSMVLCTALLMVSCAGLAGMFVRRKKNAR